MTQTPPGWYPDPGAPPGVAPHVRYWDGAAWTQHVQPVQGGPPAPRPWHGPTTPDGQRLAGWWWRGLALLLDTVVLGIAGNVLTLPWQIDIQRRLDDITQRYIEEPADRGESIEFSEFWDAFLQLYRDDYLGLLLLPMAIGVAYYAAFLRWKGATPGKLACGLQVRLRERPGRLEWSTITVRVGVQTALPWVLVVAGLLSGSLAVLLLCYFAATGFWLVNVLWAAGSKKKQALHDIAAATNVVKIR
jgi:uncharacterized RDD family membrane protein YckC